MPNSSPNLLTGHSGKMFGIVYIILTGMIVTIIPAASLWSWVGKSASYLFKLAPLLWWALPAKNLAQVTPGNNRQAAHDWIPDRYIFFFGTGASVEDLDGVLLGIDKARLSLDKKKVPLEYD
ncbi:hypothetical protein DSO57_1031606 [Entomophthora muscae]|uniref:Uncharacterized protein n=1 Tax=Entomophthora muscae TaxID=34485 RepID=A0ACC2T134_9FUNG|nr:hypothetical protein DSO57_1031606 [Entomophthora muscae]